MADSHVASPGALVGKAHVPREIGERLWGFRRRRCRGCRPYCHTGSPGHGAMLSAVVIDGAVSMAVWQLNPNGTEADTLIDAVWEYHVMPRSGLSPA